MLLVPSALPQPIDRITRNVKYINTFISEVFFFERPEEFRMTSYADGVGIGQINAILKSHDKNMAELCVSCGE